MALTKISRGLLDTGVSDSSDATAITINSSEQVAIGITTPTADLTLASRAYNDSGAGSASGIRFTDGGDGTADAMLQSIRVGNDGAHMFVGSNCYIATGGSATAFDTTENCTYVDCNAYSGAVIFGTSAAGSNPSERMRIDSSAVHNGGMFRAGGWYGTYSAFSTGHSMEIGRSGSYGYSLSYDRSAGQYKSNIVSGYDIRFQTQGNQRLIISDTGHLYPYADNTYDLGTSAFRFDDVYATNTTIQTSDRNEKNTITDTDLGLDFINKLSPKSYKFNNGTRTHYGLIAQDVEDVLGDINKPTADFAGFIKNQKYRMVGEEVTNDDGTIISEPTQEEVEGEHTYGLRYSEFISPMIKAIQELKAENDSLKTRIETLENA